MQISYTPEQEQLQHRLREYFAGLMTPERRASLAREGGGDYGDGGAYKELVRRLGRDGWLALGWPAEYGGQNGSMLDQLIFMDEASVAGVPVPFLTINTVGPTIMRFGTPEQKERFLPAIAAGDLHFSIGYSEPGAGTDLASLRTRAVRDGDMYVISGQKMWTSLIQYADFVWLACRTDPQAVRHKGLSIIIVPTDAAGFSWTPVRTVAGLTTSATYYADVRVPVSMRVGAENQGWRLVTTQLNHERVMLGPAGRLGALHDRVSAWASACPGRDGQPLSGQPDVRRALAEVGASLRVNELLNWQVAVADTVEIADASATKVFSSEWIQRLGQLLIDVVGRHGDPADELTADLMSCLDAQHKRNLVLTFGGGVNEVQRELIAMAGLGLPRVPR